MNLRYEFSRRSGPTVLRAVVVLFSFLFAQTSWADAPASLANVASVSAEWSCFKGDFANAESFIAFIARQSPRQQGPEQQAAIRKEFERLSGNFECKWFDYRVDDLMVRGFLIRPRSGEPGKLPVVLFNRGGNADHSLREMYLFGKLFPLAAQGFIVIGSQYRGAEVDGRPNPDRLRDQFGGEDVNDVLALLPIIDALNGADAEKIGLWGQSRGAIMSFLAARKSNRFTAMVVEGAPTDLAAELEWRPEMEAVFKTWVPNFETNRSAAVEARSVIHWADKLPASLPILILHGGQDRRVSAASALSLAARLQELHRPYQLMIYHEAGHSLRQFESEVQRETTAWFKRFLGSSSVSQQ